MSPRKVWKAGRSMARRYARSIAGALAGRSGPGHEPNPDLRAIIEHEHAAAWLGHASVLIRHSGMTILTDPVFSERIGPRLAGRVLGPVRLRPVPLTPEDLPAVDLVLISHAHFDHLDRPTLEYLASRAPGGTRVVTAAGTRRLIPRGFGKGGVVEVAWEGEVEVGSLKIRAVRPRHWGARRAIDHRREYSSYVLEGDAGRVLYAGDTGWTSAFEGLGRDGRLSLAVFGIGSYDPWEHAHATPEQVWSMFVGSGARALLPVHHSTFQLGDEGEGEALSRLIAASGPDRARIIEAPAGVVWTQG